MNLIAKNNFLEWALGDDPQRAGTPQLQWANMPESWGVFVLIAAIAAVIFSVFWMYRREIGTCPKGAKMVMACLRLAVLLLLIAMFLKPSVFYQQVNEIKPTIAMLRDSSLSFDRGDNYRSADRVTQLAKTTGISADEIGSGNIKRSMLVNQAFNKNPELLELIRDKGAIRVVNFSDGNTPVAVIPAITTQEKEKAEREAKEKADGKTDDGNDEESAAVEGADGTGETDGLIRDSIPDLEANGLGTDIWQALRVA